MGGTQRNYLAYTVSLKIAIKNLEVSLKNLDFGLLSEVGGIGNIGLSFLHGRNQPELFSGAELLTWLAFH